MGVLVDRPLRFPSVNRDGNARPCAEICNVEHRRALCACVNRSIRHSEFKRIWVLLRRTFCSMKITNGNWNKMLE
jgi:hypothetical protein